MMKLLKNILVSAMLSIGSYFPSKERELEDTESSMQIDGQLEPRRVMDEWDEMLHHDDVTEQEIEELFSDDPEVVMARELEVLQRQAEFLQMWNDKDTRREKFQSAYLKNANLDRIQRTMDQLSGWEDDDHMPESFLSYDDEGNPVFVRFDDLPEWRNVNDPRNENQKQTESEGRQDSEAGEVIVSAADFRI